MIIHLTEATLGYLEKQSYTPEKQEHYFVPVVVFSGMVTDQYGNTYPTSVIVPALSPEVFADEEPQPMPVPLMMKGVPEPAVAPKR